MAVVDSTWLVSLGWPPPSEYCFHILIDCSFLITLLFALLKLPLLHGQQTSNGFSLSPENEYEVFHLLQRFLLHTKLIERANRWNA